uniref:Uncharacterized protein n=1 Tax=Tanacetum cinerariifolium TaxID=118510 RepID=A0A699GLH7_TANCI|nr:hypothetical protein [Tanacetum cinerariifolium]
MDNPNITMEEYIRLKEEKAQKHGKVFNWETAKYSKMWYDEDVHDLRSVETEFPAIVFNHNLTSNETLSCEPTVSSLNKNEIDFRISFDESDDEDYTGQSVFTSRDRRRLFDIRGPFIYELNLEFFSTFSFGEAELDLDTVEALQEEARCDDIRWSVCYPYGRAFWVTYRGEALGIDALGSLRTREAPRYCGTSAATTYSRTSSYYGLETVVRLSQMMSQDGVRYTSYADFQILYERHTKCRTNGASTSTAQQDEQEPNL